MVLSPARTTRHVALLIETSRAYGRGLLEGIARYVREHGAWKVRLQDRGLNDPPPGWLADWPVDGVLARIETRELEARLQRLGKPVINLCGAWWTGSRLPVLDTDDAAVARLAFDHLRERGFPRLGYCGFGGTGWSETRGRCFAALAAAAGLACDVFPGARPPRPAGTLAAERSGLRDEEPLRAWLQGLRKPVGLLAANDLRGQQLLDLCADLGLNVPDEVGVLGVDNDALLCALTTPPLSSVVPDCAGIGYAAAGQLESLMAGRRPSGPAAFPPTGVAIRGSTDVLVLEDPQVVRALRVIREQACNGIGVEQVLKGLPLSRSSLERRFTRLVGRPPKAEILRLQLERARQLLVETDWTLAAVAERCGFRHPEHFCTLFKRKTGLTPGQFRKQHGP